MTELMRCLYSAIVSQLVFPRRNVQLEQNNKQNTTYQTTQSQKEKKERTKERKKEVRKKRKKERKEGRKKITLNNFANIFERKNPTLKKK